MYLEKSDFTIYKQPHLHQSLAILQSNMNILMISDVYFPRINGVSTSIKTFMAELQQQGNDVTLIAPDYEQASSMSNVIRIPSLSVPLDPEDRMMRLSHIIRLIPSLKTKNFNLIHIHTPFIAHIAGIKLSKRLHIPAVITYHTLFEEYLYHYIPLFPKSVWRFFARRLSSYQCNQAHGVIVPSSIMIEVLKKYGVNIPITMIPTGIDVKKFSTPRCQHFQEKFNIPKNKKICLTVSRLAFEKNIEFLLKVIQHARPIKPEIHFIIAGEGPAKKHYKKLICAMHLQDHISLVGYLDHDTDLIDCYHFSDIFIFSSKTETQGLVLLEAMACGLPIVSLAEMGALDILKNCSSAFIPDENIEQFSQVIINLLSDDHVVDKYAIAAKQHAYQWDTKTLTHQMKQFYQHTIQTYHDISNSN